MIRVYDFDKTIYNGDSTQDFFKFCIKKQPAAALNVPRFLLYICLYLFKLISKERLKECFYRFLKRLPDTSAAVSDFWSKHKKNIAPWYLKQKQADDIIISASPEFLLKPICEELGVRLIASKVNPKTGLYSGMNCHGNEKCKRLAEEYPNCRISDFYSDSLSDLPLALLSENAWLVKNGKLKIWENNADEKQYAD